MLLSRVTGGLCVALMSLLGVLKLHTTPRRQTARYRRTRRSGRRAPGPHPCALKSVLLYGSEALKEERSQDFCWLDSCRAQAEDSMCVRMYPSWGTSSAETVGGSVVSLYSCARARRVKSCRGSRTHTHTATVGSFSHAHSEAKTPGVRAGTMGAWFSHLELVFHAALGCVLSLPSGAQGGWPLHGISQSASPLVKYEDSWRYSAILSLMQVHILFFCRLLSFFLSPAKLFLPQLSSASTFTLLIMQGNLVMKLFSNVSSVLLCVSRTAPF